MLDAVMTLVKTVPGLERRTEGALQLARLRQQNALPQVTPAAFVSPAGIAGDRAEVATGAFRQQLTDVVAVTLVLRASDDPRAARAIDPLADLVRSVIEAVAGNRPIGATGPIVFLRGFLVSMADAAVTYQLEFSVTSHMRLAR